jgi:hypothetical protein
VIVSESKGGRYGVFRGIRWGRVYGKDKSGSTDNNGVRSDVGQETRLGGIDRDANDQWWVKKGISVEGDEVRPRGELKSSEILFRKMF